MPEIVSSAWARTHRSRRQRLPRFQPAVAYRCLAEMADVRVLHVQPVQVVGVAGAADQGGQTPPGAVRIVAAGQFEQVPPG